MNIKRASHNNDKNWDPKVAKICEITEKDKEYVCDALAYYNGNYDRCVDSIINGKYVPKNIAKNNQAKSNGSSSNSAFIETIPTSKKVVQRQSPA